MSQFKSRFKSECQLRFEKSYEVDKGTLKTQKVGIKTIRTCSKGKETLETLNKGG